MLVYQRVVSFFFGDVLDEGSFFVWPSRLYCVCKNPFEMKLHVRVGKYYCTWLVLELDTIAITMSGFC